VSHRYTPLRYARVGEATVSGDRLLPVEWVMLARWEFSSGDDEFCVEYLDAAGETAGDVAHFPAVEEAEQHATAEFGLASDDWRDGHPNAASA
jgi:hypothetical protein